MSSQSGALKVDNKLPNADLAMQLLKRVAVSSEPILKRHRLRVLRLEEITKNLNKSEGIVGFCMPAGDGKTSNLIALVLRDEDGVPMSFLEVMGTMLHEITHIIHLQHRGPFYRRMAELIEEWETEVMRVQRGHLLDSEGSVVNEDHPALTGQNVGIFVGTGRKLGGKTVHWKRLSQRELARAAAERRARDAARGFGDKELMPMVRHMLQDQRKTNTRRPVCTETETGDCCDEEELMSLIQALHESELCHCCKQSRIDGQTQSSTIHTEKLELENALARSMADGQSSECSDYQAAEQMEINEAIALSLAEIQVPSSVRRQQIELDGVIAMSIAEMELVH